MPENKEVLKKIKGHVKGTCQIQNNVNFSGNGSTYNDDVI